MQHHIIDLQITEADRTALLAHYDELLQKMERQLPVSLPPLQKALLEVLSKHQQWQEIEAFPSTQHHAIHLRHEDSSMLNLPWQLALEGKGYRYLSKGLPNSNEVCYEAHIPLPLKILVMIASPENASIESRLSYEEEEARIIEAFEPLFEQGNVEVDFTDDGSLESLEAKLQRNHYHILHFSGHGIYKNGTGYLQLEDPLSLEERLVTAEQFAASLNKTAKHLPPLILLSSCQTAQGSKNESGFRGVTNQLLQIGVPAVVAMGFSILDVYATAFAAHFYEQLAQEITIPRAFKAAVAHIREVQEQQPQQRYAPQWIIPQLYTQQQIEDFADWQQQAQRLYHEAFKFATGANALILEKSKNFLFIGRRRERKAALSALYQSQTQPILLKGQGGVGKTTLAEHLVQRMVARNPRIIPFTFNENTTSLEIINKQLMDFFEDKKDEYLIESEVEEKTGKDAIKAYKYLLGKLKKEEDYDFIFLFDNLESFQDGKTNAAFQADYEPIQSFIQFLMKRRSFPLILTGRYPLSQEAFPDLEVINLNQVGFASFYVKCQQLQLSEMRTLLRQKNSDWKGERIPYKKVIRLLHQTLGGNYRALEFFDRLYAKSKAEILPTLERLEDLQNQIASKGADVVQEMSIDLVFADLLALLDTESLESLKTLSHFRIPVLELALQLQSKTANFQQLLDLTLVEAHANHYQKNQNLTYYYVTPIVRQLLAENDSEKVAFDHRQAARYYEYADQNINHRNYSDLEEAYFHYYQIVAKAKVNEIGNILCGFYYRRQLFPLAWQYGQQVEQLLGAETHGRIWSNLGLIAQMYGHLDIALAYNHRSLEKYQVENNGKAEGALLNNISQIYSARGEYATALGYLEQSLAIRR
ncbi:MAG: CHAT domain-containing protein, partial [Bacteroidota bacterium]